MPSQATEEPEYRSIRTLEDVELREYGAYTVAEVVVPGPADDAGNQAFPILAGYIFGKNKGERKFEMTAPVTQAAVPVKLEMTAPVTQTAAPGGFLVQFVLPRGVSLATAPEPLDARVRLREVAPSRVAVIRYSGFWSTSNYDQHLAKLQAALRAAGLAWTGEAVYSRYNAPFTPWFMRRNEIWLHLSDAG
ncbi:MAG: heme-binding protein [Ideonella sp.]|nr:heme-binding protein [Ideonella sp.]